MSEGKGQRKWPIPPGFTWSHALELYKHEDGRTWDPDVNETYDKVGNKLRTSIELPIDPRQIPGGGPRVLPADIEAAIRTEKYLVEDTLTICILVLQNGFRVTGESACAAPENFDAAKGRELARKAACEKIWPLLGYVLRDQLRKQEQP